MKNEIRFEFRKLFRQKTFYICGGVVAIMAVIQVLLMYFINRVSETSLLLGLSVGTTGSDFFLTSASFMEIPIIFPIFISLFICVDFSSGTIKNILSRGISRTEVFFGKLTVISATSMIYLAVSLFISVVLGSIIWGFGDFEAEILVCLAIQMLCVIGFAAMNAFISFFFRKIGPSLAFGILISTVVQLITQIIDLVCELKGIEDVHTAKFTITGCMQMAVDTGAETGDLLWAAAVPVIYIVLFLGFGWLLFRKREA